MKTEFTEQTDSVEIKSKTGSRALDAVEGFLKAAFLAAFILLIAAQIFLIDPDVRSSLNTESADGESLGKEAHLIEPCKMELKLINMQYCPELRVLVNGDSVGAFENNAILLELKDGDVVELDANDMLVFAEVQISAVSRNISYLLGRTLTAADGIIPAAIANTQG